MDIVFAAVVAHNSIVGNATLRLVLDWFASLCDLTGVDDAAAHPLVEGASHVEAVLLIINHAFSVGFA